MRQRSVYQSRAKTIFDFLAKLLKLPVSNSSAPRMIALASGSDRQAADAHDLICLSRFSGYAERFGTALISSDPNARWDAEQVLASYDVTLTQLRARTCQSRKDELERFDIRLANLDTRRRLRVDYDHLVAMCRRQAQDIFDAGPWRGDRAV